MNKIEKEQLVAKRKVLQKNIKVLEKEIEARQIIRWELCLKFVKVEEKIMNKYPILWEEIKNNCKL